MCTFIIKRQVTLSNTSFFFQNYDFRFVYCKLYDWIINDCQILNIYTFFFYSELTIDLKFSSYTHHLKNSLVNIISIIYKVLLLFYLLFLFLYIIYSYIYILYNTQFVIIIEDSFYFAPYMSKNVILFQLLLFKENFSTTNLIYFLLHHKYITTCTL